MQIQWLGRVEYAPTFQAMKDFARQPSATDRRSVVVVLTPRGRHAMNRIAIEHRAELRRIAPELARHMRHFAK